VTSIGDRAFSSCRNITSLIVDWDIPLAINESLFESSNYQNATLYVPEGTKALYEAADVWKDFGNIVEKDEMCGVEVYAVMKDAVLTIYYDKLRSTREGYIYDLYDYRPWSSSMTKVVFDSSVANYNPSSLRYFFSEFSEITEIEGLHYLNTSNVTDMSQMFYGCSSLTSVDVSNFDTRNVTDMLGMFYGCSSLTSVDVSNFDTRNVTDMAMMFERCSSLTSVDVSNFNTKNVAEMFEMFLGCKNLKNIDVSGFDTRNVTNMSRMFKGCNSLEYVDVSNFITDKVTSMGYMFADCYCLKNVDVSKFDTSSLLNDSHDDGQTYAMFLRCHGIEEIVLGDKFTKISDQTFQECYNLKTVILGKNIASIGDYAFIRCNSLTSVTVGWETPLMIDGLVFTGFNCKKATLYVPKGTKALYEAANLWKDFGKIVEIDENIIIGEEGMGTYCSTHALDFSGIDDIKAYIVSAFKPSTGEVTLTRITDVPANTGIVVKGAAGTYTMTPGLGETIVSNMLRGVTMNTVLNKVEGDYTNYILAKKNGNLGFYAVVDGSTLSAHKAYLPLPTASLPSGARSIKLVFEDGGTTGISDASPLNDNGEMINDNVYDLQGRRVEKPTRGLYIVNGRKFVIK